MDIANLARSILQLGRMDGRPSLDALLGQIRSPLMALLDASPRALATRLLDEIARGMVPVWPSTERHADRLVEGLSDLREERGVEVMRAIAMAPRHAALDWPTILRPLHT